MLIVAVNGPDCATLCEAMGEHGLDTITVGPGADLSCIPRENVTEVLAATPGAANTVGLTQPFGDFPLARDQFLPAGASPAMEAGSVMVLKTEACFDSPDLIRALEVPARFRPRYPDDANAEWICTPGEDPGALFRRIAGHAPEWVVDAAPQGRRYEVQAVCDGGRVLCWVVFELRLDVKCQQSLLRHVITLPASKLRDRLCEGASSVLRTLGVKSGMACVEAELTSRDTLRLLDVRSAPIPGWSRIDAAFVATGTSLEYLLAERAHDIGLFNRRLEAVAQGLGVHRQAMAVSSIRSWDSQRIAGFAGVPLVRHAAAFREIRLPPLGSPSFAGEICGWAVFIHPDEHMVHHALSVLHELEDSASLSAASYDFVAIAR